MSVVLIKDKLTNEQFREAKKDYSTYIKITIDVMNNFVAVGGEYHADAEKVLLENGARQENIWGGGVNLETNSFETNAIINIRPGKNPSSEIIDLIKRERFLVLAKKALKTYVR